ncbi:MAG: restriction endonuclease, partial [Planctomycetes bacterium]|nr:restriction endonuclease [Planctomycetota bacterium]
IKGGVVITYRDAKQDFGNIGVFTNFDELNSILDKVNSKHFKSFSNIIYSAFSYQFASKIHQDHPEVVSILSKGHKNDISTAIFDTLPQIFLTDKPKDTKDYIQFYGLAGKKRVYRWVKKEYVKKHPNLEKYKVWVPKANGSGAIGEVLSTPLIGTPLIGTTHSFISIGAFDSKKEAENTLKYVKTKFARTLLGVLKITQDNPPEKWSKVPLQDFTKKSDIDWSKSIPEIDKKLYAKYGLDKKEIDFIETNVKAMA